MMQHGQHGGALVPSPEEFAGALVLAPPSPEEFAGALVPVEESLPDICNIFYYYNEVYFQDTLGSCLVSWSDTTRSTGTCKCSIDGFWEIRLSKHLKSRPATDLKNVLLHEMIHAFLGIKNVTKDHSKHKAHFRALMDAINSSTLSDNLKPLGGYNINTYHNFDNDVGIDRAYHWTCEFCGDLFHRTTGGEPSANDCISYNCDKTCDNELCQWHRHKSCSGRFILIQEESPGQIKKSTTPEAVISETKGEPEIQKNKFQGFWYTRSRARKPVQTGESELLFKDSYYTVPTVQSLALALFPATPKRPRTPASRKKLIKSSRDVEQSSGPSERRPDLKDTIASVGSFVIVPERERPLASSTKLVESSRKRKRCNELSNRRSYNVIVQALGIHLYSDEEGEECVEPLVNKITERRKKRKLMESQVRVEEYEDIISSDEQMPRKEEEDMAIIVLEDDNNDAIKMSEPCELLVDIVHSTVECGDVTVQGGMCEDLRSTVECAAVKVQGGTVEDLCSTVECDIISSDEQMPREEEDMAIIVLEDDNNDAIKMSEPCELLVDIVHSTVECGDVTVQGGMCEDLRSTVECAAVKVQGGTVEDLCSTVECGAVVNIRDTKVQGGTGEDLRSTVECGDVKVQGGIGEDLRSTVECGAVINNSDVKVQGGTGEDLCSTVECGAVINKSDVKVQGGTGEDLCSAVECGDVINSGGVKVQGGTGKDLCYFDSLISEDIVDISDG